MLHILLADFLLQLMALFSRCQSGISHVIVRCNDGKYDVGSGNRFNSLSQLVNYYKENPQLRDAKTHNIINLEEVFVVARFATL